MLDRDGKRLRAADRVVRSGGVAVKPRRFTVERRDGTVLAYLTTAEAASLTASRMNDVGVLVVRDARTGAEEAS